LNVTERLDGREDVLRFARRACGRTLAEFDAEAHGRDKVDLFPTSDPR
jgi:hypothetical protein